MDEFMCWAASQGISDNTENDDESSLAIAEAPVDRASCIGRKLALAHFDDGSGRGLAATCNLSKGEAVLQAPKEALMSALSARTSDPLLAHALVVHTHLSSHQVLVLHLLHEVSKGAASRWALYLKQLPRRYSTLANFSHEAAQELQVPEAIIAATDAAEAAYSDWLAASPVLRQLAVGPKFCGLQAWLWGAATVSSRSLYVPWDSAGALCPVGDLFNYAPPVEGASDGRMLDGGYEEERGMYRFYARQDYTCGEQVFLCYGLHSNLDLLQHYGFILPLNPNDTLRISLPPSHLLRPTPHKTRVWGRPPSIVAVREHLSESRMAQELGGEVGVGRPEKYSIEADGQPSFSLLAALRILAEPGNVRKKHRHLAISGERISWVGDVAVYDWLRGECHVLFSKLPTSIVEDEGSLRGSCTEADGRDMGENSQPDVGTKINESCDQNVHLAICWRLGYKLLTSRAFQYCVQMAAQLQEER